MVNGPEPAPDAADFGVERDTDADSEDVAPIAEDCEAGLAGGLGARRGPESELAAAAEDGASRLGGSLGVRRKPESETVGSFRDAREEALPAAFAVALVDGVGSVPGAEPGGSLGARREPESDSNGSTADERELELAAVDAREVELVEIFGACCTAADSEAALLGPRAALELLFGPGREPDSEVLEAAAHEPVAELDFALGERRRAVSDVVSDASRARDPDAPGGDVVSLPGFDVPLPVASAAGIGEAGCGAGAAADDVPPPANSGRSN